MSESKKSWVSTGEIAGRLGISLPTVRRLLDIQSVEVNKHYHGWRIDRKAADDFVKSLGGA